MAPSAAALTIYAFGLMSLTAGCAVLFSTLRNETAPCTVAQAGNGLAAVAMGIYYPIAAYQDNQTFFIATVPMRTLTTVIFAKLGLNTVAIWEGSGALLTALALVAGWRTEGKVKERKS